MSELSPLQRMQKAVILRDVFVRRAQAYVQDDFDPKYTEEKLGLQIKFTASEEVERFELTDDSDPNEKHDLIRYSIETGVRFVAVGEGEPADPPVRAEVTATFIAEYVIADRELFDDEGIAAFARNAAYHVWPYWRELIHSTSNRLRLPAAVLPMFQPKSTGLHGDLSQQ
jgi:hypothetical protein